MTDVFNDIFDWFNLQEPEIVSGKKQRDAFGNWTKVYKCRRCGGSEYSVYPSTGYRYCVPCDAKIRRQWYANNQHWVAESRRRRAAFTKTEEGKKMIRWEHTATRYGITRERYAEMLAQQDGKCAICRDVPRRDLHIDHCHATGAVRGLLCNRCNTGLGQFRDRADFLETARLYVLSVPRSDSQTNAPQPENEK